MRIFGMNKLSNGIFFGLSLTLSTFVVAETKIQSGIYEQILIAVTPDNKIEAYYHELTGNNNSMSCSFYIQGDIKTPNNIKISIKSMEQYTGNLAFNDKQVTLTINEDYHLAGCSNSLAPSVLEGSDYSLTYIKKWISLKTISAEKAYLYKQPNLDSIHKAYVVKGNVVAVLEEKGNWTKVEYKNENDKFHKGWITKEQYITFSETKW